MMRFSPLGYRRFGLHVRPVDINTPAAPSAHTMPCEPLGAVVCPAGALWGAAGRSGRGSLLWAHSSTPGAENPPSEGVETAPRPGQCAQGREAPPT